MKILDFIAGFKLADITDDYLQGLYIRETQALRVHQSHHALYLVFITGTIYILTLWSSTNHTLLVIWMSLVFLSSFIRTYACKHIEKNLSTATTSDLYNFELLLLFTSLGSTSVIGSGLWVLNPHNSSIAFLVIVLTNCIYAIGTTINSSVHYKNFPLLLLANLGQVILFFLIQGEKEYYAIAAIITSILILLLKFGKQNSDILLESIKIRTENIEKNAALLREKETTESALELAKKANDDKNRFLAAASHDLRQPLHALGLFIVSLKQKQHNDESKEIISRIDEVSNVLSNQFNSLLDLSKFESGVIDVNLASFRIDKLVNRIVEENRILASNKNLQINLKLFKTSVYSDELLLERLIRNLLINAIKFTNEGSIEITTKIESENVSLSVIDSGIGIDKKDQESIFNDFSQVNNPARQKHQGSGLGLSIVKRIDRLLNLKLSLASEINTGSTFTILIPVATDQFDTKLINSPETSNNDVLQHSKNNVLIVDDDPDILEGLTRQVKLWELNPIAANSSEQAFQQIELIQSNIGFAIIDDMLGSDSTGLDIADKLANTISKSKILIVTGNIDQDRQLQIKSAGFELLQKPVKPEKLKAVVIAGLSEE